MNRALILFLSVFTAMQAFSQTRLIFHKSHGGSASTYRSFGSAGNFGLPPPRLEAVEKIDDTTVVLMHSEVFDTSRVWGDTIYNHPLFSDPNMTVDSLKKTYYYNGDVEFRNFGEHGQKDGSPQPGKQEEGPGIAPKVPAGKMHEQQKKNMLWLFVIGAGTFLAAGLAPRLFRSRIPARRA